MFDVATDYTRRLLSFSEHIIYSTGISNGSSSHPSGATVVCNIMILGSVLYTVYTLLILYVVIVLEND